MSNRHVGLVKFTGLVFNTLVQSLERLENRKEKKERMIEKEQNMEYNKGCKEKIDEDTRHLKRKERWVDYQDIRSTRGELFPFRSSPA